MFYCLQYDIWHQIHQILYVNVWKRYTGILRLVSVNKRILIICLQKPVDIKTELAKPVQCRLPFNTWITHWKSPHGSGFQGPPFSPYPSLGFDRGGTQNWSHQIIRLEDVRVSELKSTTHILALRRTSRYFECVRTTPDCGTLPFNADM